MAKAVGRTTEPLDADGNPIATTNGSNWSDTFGDYWQDLTNPAVDPPPYAGPTTPTQDRFPDPVTTTPTPPPAPPPTTPPPTTPPGDYVKTWKPPDYGDKYQWNPIGDPGNEQNRLYSWYHPELWTGEWLSQRPDGQTGPITKEERMRQIDAEYAKTTHWWDTATGLFEGPKNDWGMDTSQPDLPGFPQWDTATSLKYRFGREVAKYAPTVENAQKVIQDALANGWDIRPDDNDPTMFWFHHEDGTWEAVRLLSGSNTWEFNWGSNATGGNSEGTTTPTTPTTPPPTTTTTDLGPFVPPTTPPPTTLAPPTTTTPTTPPPTTTTTLPPNDPNPGGSTGTKKTLTPEEEIQKQMREELLKLLNQPEINAETLQNDPAVRAQRIQAQRAEERQRAQRMEQNALEGLSDSGAEQTDLAGARQQRSESEAAFIGQLAIQQMQARREDIKAAIQIATQQGQFDLSQKLSRELADLTAAIERERIASTERDNAAQRQVMREDIAARLGDNAASRALQERLAKNQLTQQDKQFLLSLGFNYTQLQVQANADATRGITG